MNCIQVVPRRKSLRKQLWIGIILAVVMLLLGSIKGCTIGTKERIRYVHTSYNQHTKIPGAIQIMENRKIQVQVIADELVITKMDLGGYYAVPEQDMLGFLEALDELSPDNEDNNKTIQPEG